MRVATTRITNLPRPFLLSEQRDSLTTPNLFPTNQPIQEDNGTLVPPSGLSAMWPYFPENVPYNFVIVVQPYSATMHSSYLNGNLYD